MFCWGLWGIHDMNTNISHLRALAEVIDDLFFSGGQSEQKPLLVWVLLMFSAYNLEMRWEAEDTLICGSVYSKCWLKASDTLNVKDVVKIHLHTRDPDSELRSVTWWHFFHNKRPLTENQQGQTGILIPAGNPTLVQSNLHAFETDHASWNCIAIIIL